MDAKIKDNVFSVDLESKSGWKQHLIFGPMNQKEWVQTAQVEDALFAKDEKTHSFKNYVDKIPSNVFYVDCDYFRENVSPDEFASMIEDVLRQASSRVKRLIDYYKNG